MKEKFDNRRLFGAINVKCKNDDDTFRMWSTRKETVVKNIISIVNRYEELGYRLTLHQTAYKKLGTILDDCRYAGIIDWNNIEDRGRQLNYPYYEDGIPEALQRTINCYRLERQLGQPVHIEVWTEKDALSAIFNRSTNKYGIGLCVNKGYTSSSAIYNACQRFCNCFDNGQSVVILYFGDHDSSGLDMIRDIRERLEFMFNNYPDDFDFKVEPIGLTMKQIKKYKLPANPAKLTDSRSTAYIEQFGPESWEVDALNPEILTEIVETNIAHNMDYDIYLSVLDQEEKDISKLRKIINDNRK